VVVWSDDEGARRVAALSARDAVLVGTHAGATWPVLNVVLAKRGASFTLKGPGETLDVKLGVTGAHNVANAAVVAVLARALDVTPAHIVAGLAAFKGAPRRFQFLGKWRGVDVYEDYAHLPGEIAATLAAARSIGYQRITAVFQPHRVTRTLNLAPQFALAFAGANNIIVTDIYPAGEANPTAITGELIVTRIRLSGLGATCAYGATFNDVLELVESKHDQSDVILLLGAGDVANVAQYLSGGLT
jgi:UDP-N-acetylmuramate--alanine ligase